MLAVTVSTSPIDSMCTVLNMNAARRLGLSTMGRIHIPLCVTGGLLVLTGFAWANGLGDIPAQISVPALSFSLDDQADTRSGEPQFGEMGPAELSPATDDEAGVYDRFEDQIGTLLAGGQAVKPQPDRFKWAILLIAFAGMTAAASGRRRARRATISI